MSMIKPIACNSKSNISYKLIAASLVGYSSFSTGTSPGGNPPIVTGASWLYYTPVCFTSIFLYRSKIHVIRGQQVMLDFELAQIYGYETKNFNRQVKNNIERFDSDFMFQLSDAEIQELSRCKIFTLNKGRGSNIKYAPYAFTEQGIYFQGQIFDAYAKFESFIAQAKKEIILIDNYVDLSILQRLAKALMWQFTPPPIQN